MKKILKNFLSSEIDPAFAKRAEIIFKNIEKYKPKKVLDVGCGRGFYIKSLTFYKFIKEIHGIDINKNYLNQAKKIITNDERISLKLKTIYKTDYPNNYFDLIIASEVLEHLKNDQNALKEIRRILKPKGKLIITVPQKNFPFFWDPINWTLMKFFNTHIDKNIWWLAGIWADHERLYDKKMIIELLKSTGFKILSIKEIIHWSWPFSHFLLYGIGKNIVEKLKINEFNRFYFNSDKKISKILACLFEMPSNILDKKIKLKSSVGLVTVGENLK